MVGDALAKKRTREAPTAVLKSPGDAVHTSAAATETTAEDSQDQNVDLSSDIKGILAALQQVRQKAITDGQKKSEEIINSMSTEIKSLMDEAKKKVEKERQNLAITASKVCKEYDAALKDEAAKYKKAFETFCHAKDAHLQAYQDIFSTFEDAKEKLLVKCEQQRKKEKVALSDLQRICTEKIAVVEHSVKKKKQDEKSMHMLRKSLGNIFDSDGSDEDSEG